MLTRLLTVAYRAALVLLYPGARLDRVGDDMVECFEDLLAEEHRWRGAAGVILAATRTFLDLPRSALGAQREERKTTTGGTMGTLFHDVRFALRGLAKAPVFTLLAALSLGLGVGANTSMFSMINATLWSELPVPDGEEIVRVSEVREASTPVSFANFVDIAAEADVFDGAFLRRMETFGLVADEISKVAHGEIVTANFFEVMEIEPALGRFFDATEHGAAESPPVLVISHYLWTAEFGADPAVVGSTVLLNETPFTIIGVAPESFHGTKFGLSLDLWVPIGPWSVADGWSVGWRESRGSRSVDMFARLADDIPLEGANAALATIAARLAEEYPEVNATMTLRASPQVAGQISPDQAGIPTLIGLLAIFGSSLVLLVACGNVASLLLARAVARRQEMGVRIALGAGRGRLVRLLLTEGLLLAGLGALVGVGVAAWMTRLNAHFLPKLPMRFAIDTSPDLAVVGFAASVSLAAVLVFGLVPALQASRSGVAGVLRGDDEAGGMRVSGARLLNGVVVGVVALSFVTLFLAGLFGASLSHVRSLDPGFAKEGRVMATLDFGLAGMNAREGTRLHEELIEAVTALPGVTTAALSGPIPMGDFSASTRTYADDREYGPDELGPVTWYTATTPGWLDVSGMQLLSGRWLGATDDSASAPVVVVNEALANAYWPDTSPIGQRLRLGRQTTANTFEIVGVVATGKYTSMVEPPTPAMYFSMEQGPRSVTVLMAVTSADPGTVITPLREAIREVDPALAPTDLRTIAEHLDNAYWLFRLGAELGIMLGLLSAMLAAGGLYGIMAFRVGQRRREIGIRIALGAGAGRVLRHVLAGSLRLVVIGVAIGALVSAASSGIVESIVFGVEAGSWFRLTGVGLGLTALALVATLAPAVAATGADPVRAIKTE